jgi:RNA-binding protein
MPATPKPPQLSSSQRKWLRGQAHSLKPLVQVGKQGLSGSALRQVDAALDAHELIKVQAVAPREEKDAIAERLAGELGAEVAGRIGHIIILFRQNPDPEKRVYDLPD